MHCPSPKPETTQQRILSETPQQAHAFGGICILSGSVGTLRGGSWVVISGVRSPLTILITLLRGLITPLKTTHEPPSILHRSRAIGLLCNRESPDYSSWKAAFSRAFGVYRQLAI